MLNVAFVKVEAVAYEIPVKLGLNEKQVGSLLPRRGCDALGDAYLKVFNAAPAVCSLSQHRGAYAPEAVLSFWECRSSLRDNAFPCGEVTLWHVFLPFSFYQSVPNFSLCSDVIRCQPRLLQLVPNRSVPVLSYAPFACLTANNGSQPPHA